MDELMEVIRMMEGLPENIQRIRRLRAQVRVDVFAEISDKLVNCVYRIRLE
jgi:hypothetical protein